MTTHISPALNHMPVTSNFRNQFSSFMKPVTLFIVTLYLLMALRKLAQGIVRSKMTLVAHVIGIGLLSLVLNNKDQADWKFIAIAGATVVAMRRLPVRRLPVNNKAVLITGCDTGIGHNLAIHLDNLGFHVYAGCLDNTGEGRQRLVSSCSDKLTTVQLDVSNERQVEEAVQMIAKSLSSNGQSLWGVVNNAGICYIGNVEMMPSEDIQKVVSVNYMGPVNVCKHFLPFVRRSKGRIINVASNAGLAPVPLMGVYCASKSALATMTEVWRYELKDWGIKVATIIPSGYKTGIMGYDRQATGDRWWQQATDTVREDYGKDCFYVKFKQTNHESYLSAQFSELTENITDALLSTSPRPCYYSGFLSKALPFIYLHLPTWLSDPIMSVLVNWFEFRPHMLYPQRDSKQG